MSQENINYGAFPDDPSADAIRTAFEKVQNNFTQVFNNIDTGGVTSINKNPGAGITVSQPTGNVIVSANIANITVLSNTLSLGLNTINRSNPNPNSTTPSNVFISSSTTLLVDLPNVISNVTAIIVNGNITSNNANLGNLASANFFQGDGGLLTNISANGTLVNGTSSVTIPVINGNVNTSVNGIPNVFVVTATGANVIGTFTATGNISGGNLTTSGSLNVTGNADVGNISAINANLGNQVTANFFAGTLTTASQPNITSIGTLTGLSVNGNIVAANITANTGVFTGNGSGLTNLAGSNVSGEVSFAAVANSVAGGNVSGAVAFATTANSVAGGNVSGEVSFAAVANSVAGGNVSGAVEFATTANSVAGGNVSGAVAFATTANSVAGGNVSGQVSNSLVAGTVYTNAQPNITSVGTLTNLAVTGNVNTSNLSATGYISANGVINAVPAAGITSGTLTATQRGQCVLAISDVTVPANIFNTGDAVSIYNNTSGNINIIQGNSLTLRQVGTLDTGNRTLSQYGFCTIWFSSTNEAVISGSIGDANYAAFAGNVVFGSQPNITSVGTLSSLTVAGNVTANNFIGNVAGNIIGNIVGIYSNGTSNVDIPVANGNINTSVGGVSNVFVVTSTGVNIAGTLNSTGNANVGNISAINGVFTNISGNGSQLSSITGGNVSGQVSNSLVAGTVYTNAQPNITSVGTLTGLSVNGNIVAANITANTGVFTGNGSGLTNIPGANVSGAVAFATTANSVAGANVTGAVAFATTANSVAGGNVTGQVGNSLVAGTVYTNAQPNITSVGTLTSLGVTGNVTAGNVYANSGTIGASLLTGTLTTAAQPNITSVGTLSSLSVTGNVTAGNVYANSGTIGASLLTGTLTTAAQPNITSVGTLSSLSVTGNVTAGNIVGIFANGNSNISIPVANGDITFATANITGVGIERMRVSNTGLVLNANAAITQVSGYASNTFIYGFGRIDNGIAWDSFDFHAFYTNSTTGPRTGTERMRISNTGAVTINQPNSGVSFTTTGVAGQNIAEFNGPNGRVGIVSLNSFEVLLQPNVAATSLIAWGGNDTGNSNFVRLRADNTSSRLESGRNGTGTFRNLEVYTGANPRMIIDTNGNVGIGTNSPLYRVEISGTAGAPNSNFTGGTTLLRLTGNTSAWSEPALELGELLLPPTARIASKNEGEGGGSLIFITRDTSSNNSTLTQRMRIGGNGLVTVSNPNSAGLNAELRLVGSNVTTGLSLVSERDTSDAFVIQRDNASLIFRTNNTNRMSIANSGAVTINTPSSGNALTVNGNVITTGTVQTTTLTTGANITSGTITGNWTLTSGSRLQATYADLAEYYEADKMYEPGTVLEFGGEKEVTLATDSTTRVAGVVSTNPSYVMNSLCPGNAVAIALQGRVPVKVRGNIQKGDMLVSGGNGYARPTTTPQIGTIIGKSLENFNGKEGVIEIAIGRL